MLELKGISKRFGDVVANHDVELEVGPGEIRGIVGENGAGKTTLMAIASGLYRPDAGAIVVDGRDLVFRDRQDAIAAGINMVHQHFMLVGNLTVAENVILGARGGGSWLALSAISRSVRRLGERYGMPIDPDRRVSELSPAEEQQVEILTALYRGSRILILDEPTSVLAPTEVGNLFDTVRGLAGEGRTILFISHKLGEVLGLCDSISVMRAGAMQDTVERSRADAGLLARLMVGHEIAERAHDVRHAGGEPLLALHGVTVIGTRGESAVDAVDLELRPGEIMGIAGVEGSGQNDLIEAIAGLRPLGRGEMVFDGDDLTRLDAGERADRGIAYVPESPRRDGLLLEMPAWWNIGLRRYRGRSGWRRWFVDFSALRQRTLESLTRFDVRGAAPDTQTGLLSGGNQQKLILARELARQPKLLLVANPTAGLDIGATRFLYETIEQERNRGSAVLVVSSDLDELEAISDRIAVMYGGRIVGVVEAGRAGREAVGLLMGGVTEAADGRKGAGTIA